MTVYLDFKETMVLPNAWGAFHALGLDFYTRESRTGFYSTRKS
jgi:hypothetical protein